ncbi:MAG TPA: ribosome small subunit-dependent GTPase A [Chloroflexi bacterium]|nr:ribosome small subunit-dependent GTPase A [Chloroflexota bacterium]
MTHGIVIRARGHHYDVETTAADERDGVGRVRVCEVRGRLLLERGRDTLVAVGDRVWVLPEGEKKGLIERVDERHRVLSRQHPGEARPAEDVILANPDQALVVFAAARPEPHLRMLDRFLVIAEANELPVIICVNKVELTGEEAARARFGLYERIGYPVLYTSAKTHIGIDALRDLLTDRITVVTGPSGVGKSSLINAIHPALHLREGDLRDFMDKGRHTTRAAQLHRLPFGNASYVADTPGIRELGLYEIDAANLPFYFREMAAYLHNCRYPGCTHDHEPECAVRAAVARGEIAEARYDSYLRLLRGEE